MIKDVAWAILITERGIASCPDHPILPLRPEEGAA